jgi:protein-tyrosine phosphatase
MIDLHCHVLPGIDDGPATVEESVALARAAAAAGTRVLVATPHVSLRYANRAREIAQAAERLGERLSHEQIDIAVDVGAEIAIARIGDLPPAELRRLTLGDGRWLLIEPPFAAMAHGLEPIVADLQRRDFRVILAHPERCAAFQREPATLRSMVSAGALTSITAGSLVGRFGRPVRDFALQMLEDGLVHNVASDAHDVHKRPPGVLSEIAQVGFQALGDWLTEEVPSAILAGREIPRRPAVELPPPSTSGGRWRWPLRHVALRRA